MPKFFIIKYFYIVFGTVCGIFYKESIDKRGQFTVALSGGSTPKKLNALLASDDFRSKIDDTLDSAQEGSCQ